MMSVAARRAAAPHTSMFLRMLFRAATLRRSRAITALVAMIVAAGVATAMLTLYVDVQAKLRKEFRNYGANVIIVARDGQSLSPDAVATVQSVLGSKALAVPFSYVIAQLSNGSSVVVAGTDFQQVQDLDHWWSVTRWPAASGEALVGSRAALALSPNLPGENNQPFDLVFQGRAIHLKSAGILHTGAAEDSRIYISLADFEAWTHIAPSTIEVAAAGTPVEINRDIQALSTALPTAEVRPIRQITEAEANVLGKTRSTLYVAAALIVLTAALCVLATLIGWVFDRRADFAIMKALGASERTIAAFFAAEAGILGATGAIFGFVIGIAVAVWIGRANFHAPVTPRLSLFPTIFAGSILVSLLAAIVPLTLLRRVQPAIILRGE
jgi:putative ABC transport system permease protein